VRRPRWPELRAGLIAVAIALGLVEGCPQPEPGYERGWQREYVAILRPVQRAVLAPVAWIPRDLRFSQRWALFQVGARERFRLTVEGQARGPGAWAVLYRAGDPAHRAYAELLEYRRVQGVWNPTDRVASRYTEFASWFTARVLADRPDLEAVRIWQERILVEQGEVTGTGERWFVYTRPRSVR
jgi:hypothetical protein